jgi:hypothetical protein
VKAGNLGIHVGKKKSAHSDLIAVHLSDGGGMAETIRKDLAFDLLFKRRVRGEE